MKLLQVEALGKSFSGLRALDSVTFAVEEGETVGIMGANGAGKTTLFSIIAGNLPASAGQVLFKEQSITRFRPDRICRMGIARTFQIVRPFAGLSVRDNVETALLFGSSSRGSLSRRAEDILEEVGLEREADKVAGSLTLSGRKRLEVARALGTDPELLLLDEVMAGLTPTEVVAMIETLERVKRERKLTIIIVEHVVRAMLSLSERIVVLHHGELIADGLPDEIAQHPDVLRAYFGEASV